MGMVAIAVVGGLVLTTVVAPDFIHNQIHNHQIALVRVN
jgi:uncharacterized membrane protein